MPLNHALSNLTPSIPSALCHPPSQATSIITPSPNHRRVQDLLNGPRAQPPQEANSVTLSVLRDKFATQDKTKNAKNPRPKLPFNLPPTPPPDKLYLEVPSSWPIAASR
jgi:hypothetical protein